MTNTGLKPVMTFSEMKSYCEQKGLPCNIQFVGAFARSQKYKKYIKRKNNVVSTTYIKQHD